MHPKLLLIALSCNVMRFEVRFHLTERLKFHITHNYPRNNEKPSLPRVAARGVVFFLSFFLSFFFLYIFGQSSHFFMRFYGVLRVSPIERAKKFSPISFYSGVRKIFSHQVMAFSKFDGPLYRVLRWAGGKGAEGRPSPGRTPRRKKSKIFDFFQKS